MLNSFGQFTGDVRVSGHISQAGGEVSVCWLNGLGVFSFFFGEGGLFGSRVSLRPGSMLSSRQSQWSLDMEMTKRCTEWEGSGIALQMRWGNVALVCWAAK